MENPPESSNTGSTSVGETDSRLCPTSSHASSSMDSDSQPNPPPGPSTFHGHINVSDQSSP